MVGLRNMSRYLQTLCIQFLLNKKDLTKSLRHG